MPIPKKVGSYSFGNYNFPLITDLAYWGKIIDRSGKIKIVAPLGSWTDVFLSEEIKLVINYGYKIKVIEGNINAARFP